MPRLALCRPGLFALRTLQQLRPLWRKARTAREREALLRGAVALARAARTAAGAADVARAFPFPPVQAAAAVKWEARAAVLADFVDWLEGVDEWAATQPRGLIARIPVALWPSRMDYSARAWAVGTGGRDPDKMRVAFIRAQGEAIANHSTAAGTAADVDTFIGWAGVTGAWEVNGTSQPNPITAPDYSDSLELTAAGATRYRVKCYGWEEDGDPVPDGYVTIQALAGSWSDVWAVDFDGAGEVETVLTLSGVTAWRVKFTHDFVSLNFRPQLHVWRRDAV